MAPAAKYMKPAFNLMDLEYGCFAAVYAIGRILGAVMFGATMNVVSRKYLMIIGCFIKAYTVAIFYFSHDGMFLLFMRMLSGIGHIFPVIYAPMWTEQFGVQKHLSLMKKAMSITGPWGRASGFLIDLFFGSDKWGEGFLFNAAMCAICGVLFMFIPNIYFSNKLNVIKGKDGEELMSKSQVEFYSVYNVRESYDDERDLDFWKKHKGVLTNGIYICLLFARCVLLAIRSILQFFIPTYVTDVLGYENKVPKTIIYVIMIVLNPFIGSEISFYFTNKVGGYNSKNSMYILLLFYIFAILTFTPAPYCEVWWKFLYFSGLFQIFGSAVLPSINGIMNGSIPEELKVSSSIITSFFSAIFASVPAPIIYGLVNDVMKDYDKHYCMKMFMKYGYIGILFVGVAILLRKDYREELLGKRNKENEEKVGAEASEDINVEFKKNKDNDIEKNSTELKNTENNEGIEKYEENNKDNENDEDNNERGKKKEDTLEKDENKALEEDEDEEEEEEEK